MLRCSEPQCKYNETGICLEGHQVNCPHQIVDQTTATLPAAKTTPIKESSIQQELRRFHTGEKLTIPEASRVLNEKRGRVVLCAGSRNSGKTTFLARIGEMFRNGSFISFRFVKSLTLCGFERASWWATINSGAGRPDTKRTGRGENDTFFHLRVRSVENSLETRELLISDLAGETFPTAVGSGEFCKNLFSLRRADHIVLFLDSERLVDSLGRHVECDNGRTFLRRVIDARHQPETLHVQIVFSRWDYVLRHKDRSTLEAYCQSIEDDFKKRFEKSFASIRVERIAARPDNKYTPTNSEIQALFALWLDTPLHQIRITPPRNSRPVRDFSAFGTV
jgi:hypothetical protein